ncbi:MAG: hypothetical protein J6B24_12185 [Clostridia bacterium]|nr:hypothetical protein [Clostridia bacterium]
MKRILAALVGVLLCAAALLTCTSCGTPKLSYEEQKTAYNGIIAEYTALLTAKQNGETLTAPDTTGMDEGEAAISEAVYTAVNINNFPEDMAYTYWDMDGNGTLELLLMTSPPILKAIFTLDGETPVLLGHADENVMWYYSTKGELIRIHEALEEEQGDNTLTYARVTGTALTEDTSFGVTYEIKDGKRPITGYYEMVDGEKQTIDKERYDSLTKVYNALWDDANLYEDKLNTPCMFFPLAEGDETPPPADFSSYEAVKSTFKEMLAYLPQVNAKWPTGKLDACFTYDSDEEFRVYNYLMLMARLYIPDNGAFSEVLEGGEKAYGYCETDVNGDGVDELLLMTDDYRIFSIFTTVKGKVVYMEEYADFARKWGMSSVDGEGNFYSIKTATDGLGRERAIFTFTSDGKLTKTLHIKEVFMSENDGYFKFENGEQIRLTEEEYRTLKEDYDKLDSSRYGSGGESVRNCTDITFTPLFEIPSATHIPTDDPWAPMGLSDVRSLDLIQVGDETVSFTFNWAEYNEEGYKESTGQLQDVTATLTDGKYVFEKNGVTGYLEFGVYKIWLVVESSENEHILPRAYLFDHRNEKW